MPKADFAELKLTLDRYYESASNAIIEYEVETGRVFTDGFSHIRRAVSFVAEYMRDGKQTSLTEVGINLSAAIVDLRRRLYVNRMGCAKKLLKRVNSYQEIASPSELSVIYRVTTALRDIEKAQLEWRGDELGWDEKEEAYLKASNSIIDMLEELGSLLVNLRARELETR